MSFDLTTFLFQAINFLVLVVILWRLLWKPLRTHMSARARRIEVGLGEIAEGREEVACLTAEANERISGAKSSQAEALRRAELEAEARRAELLEEARAAAGRERERQLAQVDQERERISREFLHSLAPLVTDVVSRVLREVSVDAGLHERTCARFAERLRSLDAETRQHISGAARGGEVEIVSADGGVPQALIEAVQALLPDAHAGRATDESLVAGALLRAGDVVVDGSLRAQVVRALEQAA